MSEIKFNSNGVGRNIVRNNGNNITLVSGFTGPVIDFISRDTVSTAGGALVVFTGSGFQSDASVTFGGVTSSTVTFVNSTILNVIVPAHTTGSVSVNVAQSSGTHTLSSALTYRPAPTTTYLNPPLESSAVIATAVSPMAYNAASQSMVTSPVPSGFTRSVRTSSPIAGITAYLNWQGPNNMALIANNPNGIYLRWRQAVDQTLLDNSWSSGQAKLHTMRPLNGGGGNSWFMIGIGNAFSPARSKGEIAVVADANVVTLSGSSTGVIMTADTFVEFQVWYRRTPATNTGEAICWLNGKKVVDVTHVDDGSYGLGYNADTGIDQLFPMLSCPFTNVAGNAYCADIKLANGYIDP